MSDKSTFRMLSAYNQEAAPTLFLSGLFRSPPENFHNSEYVEIDITRSEEDTAIVITDLSTGYRMNSADIYTNKRWEPPIFKEKLAINAFDLIKRGAGNLPTDDPNFQAEATVRAFRAIRKVEAKIRRSMELQASQVLTLGVVTLTDAGGVTLYTLDYAPKGTHLPSAAIDWDDPGNTKLLDLTALSEVIRDDGQADPDMMIMGSENFELLMADQTVIPRLWVDRQNLGQIDRMTTPGAGGNYRGVLEIGTYAFQVWTYGGRYKDPVSGNVLRYIDKKKVIMLSSSGRLDATFGAIPSFAPVDSRVLPFVPSRMSSAPGGMDMFTNAWISDDNQQLFVGVGARPLMIPTAIDTFGCLDTGIV